MIEKRPYAVVATFAGAVDLATVGWLERALDAAREFGEDLRIDLRKVEFIDCGGLEVLVAAGRRAALFGGSTEIVAGVALTELLASLGGWADLPTMAQQDGRESIARSTEPIIRVGFGFTDGSAVVMHLHGDLDTASVPLVERCLRAARSVAETVVVVDMSAVGFLGVRGVAALVSSGRSAMYGGASFVVAGGSTAVRRALHTCGVHDVLRCADSLSDALAALCGPTGVAIAGARRHRDHYDHLVPMFDELAQLPDDHPRHHEIRARLITELLPVARRIAGKFRLRGEPAEDVEQVAALGLVKAVGRFNPGRGSDFLAFAVPTISGEVHRHFRDRRPVIRMPRALSELNARVVSGVQELMQNGRTSPSPRHIADHLEIELEEVLEALRAAYETQCSSLDEPVAGPAGPNGVRLGDQLGALDNELEVVEGRRAVEALLTKLPDRERRILLMRFYGDMTQTEIARSMGLSQMHVSRLLARTLASLREKLCEEV